MRPEYELRTTQRIANAGARPHCAPAALLTGGFRTVIMMAVWRKLPYLLTVERHSGIKRFGITGRRSSFHLWGRSCREWRLATWSTA